MPAKSTKRSAKVCLFGEASVGKTSLIRRFVEDKYEDKYLTTIGTKVSKKRIAVKDPKLDDGEIDYTMMVWDIMGQQGFRHLLAEAYFDGAGGAIGVCDITRKETFNELKSWIESIQKICGEIPIILLGNKSDLKDSAQVKAEELRVLAMKNIGSGWNEQWKKMAAEGRGPFLLTSAKTGENVEEAFKRLGEMMA